MALSLPTMVSIDIILHSLSFFRCAHDNRFEASFQVYLCIQEFFSLFYKNTRTFVRELGTITGIGFDIGRRFPYNNGRMIHEKTGG
jgi:hypothetical protein